MPPPTVTIPLVVSLLLALFYLWMFRDLLHNGAIGSSPLTYLGIAGDDGSQPTRRFQWTLALLFGNVVGAALYYLAEYRRRA